MRSDKAKEFSAVISLASVAVAIVGALAALTKFDWFPTTLSAMYVALAGALFSSVVSIIVSRGLRRKRQARSVFIIYSREDIAIAKELATFLHEVGLDPWLDVEQLVPGQIWRQAIVKAMQESGVAVVLLSESLYASKAAMAELGAATKVITARDKNIFPILPVRLDSTEVPKDLATVQWVNWSDIDARRKLLLGLSNATGLTLPSTGPAQEAAQAGEV